MKIDAIEQRSRDFFAVTFDLAGRAAAIPLWIAVVTTGTGVHGSDQHEDRGKSHRSRGTGDRYFAILERLTQYLEGGAMEFRQLIQKKDAVVSQTYLAGGDVGSPPQQSDVGNRMMGITEGTLPENRFTGGKQAADRVNLGRLDGLLKGHGWHDGGNATSQHGFA